MSHTIKLIIAIHSFLSAGFFCATAKGAIFDFRYFFQDGSIATGWFDGARNGDYLENITSGSYQLTSSWASWSGSLGSNPLVGYTTSFPYDWNATYVKVSFSAILNNFDFGGFYLVTVPPGPTWPSGGGAGYGPIYNHPSNPGSPVTINEPVVPGSWLLAERVPDAGFSLFFWTSCLMVFASFQLFRQRRLLGQ